MKLKYSPGSDTLYIRLSNTKIANKDMITDNLLVDFDAEDKVVGITIEQASRTTDLTAIEAIIWGYKKVIHSSPAPSTQITR